MDELIGFVLGSKQREKVMQVLVSRGASGADRIAKMGHLTTLSVKRTLGEMAGKGLIQETGHMWDLTDLGVEVQKEMKKRP